MGWLVEFGHAENNATVPTPGAAPRRSLPLQLRRWRQTTTTTAQPAVAPSAERLKSPLTPCRTPSPTIIACPAEMIPSQATRLGTSAVVPMRAKRTKPGRREDKWQTYVQNTQHRREEQKRWGQTQKSKKDPARTRAPEPISHRYTARPCASGHRSWCPCKRGGR